MYVKAKGKPFKKLLQAYFFVKNAGLLVTKFVSNTFKGNYNGWVEDHKTSGPPFICNVSLIETACHLCGDVKVVGGAYTEDEASFQAIANLETPDKRYVHEILSWPLFCLYFIYCYDYSSFFFQNCNHHFETIERFWRKGKVHYIQVGGWKRIESQILQNPRGKTR